MSDIDLRAEIQAAQGRLQQAQQMFREAQQREREAQQQQQAWAQQIASEQGQLQILTKWAQQEGMLIVQGPDGTPQIIDADNHPQPTTPPANGRQAPGLSRNARRRMERQMRAQLAREKEKAHEPQAAS